MLASDLIGLGLPAPIANRLANGGTGPVTLTAAGSNAGTAATILAEDYIVFVNAGTGGVVMPSPKPASGADGPLIYDDYVIHNGLGGNLLVYAPLGSTINIGGAAYTNTVAFTLATLKTITIYTGPTATQWFGLSA